MPNISRPGFSSLTGLFLLSACTLTFEILLTRIFSVTMWYHFAFMAISLAMFGMTVGAVAVYLFSRFFTEDRTTRHIAQASLMFGVAIVVSFLFHNSIPFVPPSSIASIASLMLNFTIVSVPFVFSGIGITLALTRYSSIVGKMYAADLAGAAAGCILLYSAMSWLDAPSMVFLCGALAGLAAWCFSEPKTKTRRYALVLTVCFAFVAALNAYTAHIEKPFVRLLWVKGALDPKPLYEKWNSYSRIAVYDDPLISRAPFGWGLSSEYERDSLTLPKQLLLNIDAGAGTVLTEFKGDLTTVEYLRQDLTNIAHYIRPGTDVLAMGAGGGRDILSALSFGQKSVTGVEINGTIVSTVNERFGEFTGHLDRYENVDFVNEEARTFINSTSTKYGIIQVSLIDTWAATAAGAFALSENGLYTLEAWQTFIQHLQPGGVLTFSRWWVQDNPVEIWRLVSLASAALKASGINDPSKHLMLLRNRYASSGGPDGIGTILVSNSPFTANDIEVVSDVAERLKFELVQATGISMDETIRRLATGNETARLASDHSLKLSAPTDDDPFFFHAISVLDVFAPGLTEQGGVSFNMKAVIILLALLLLVVLLTAVFILLPIRLKQSEPLAKRGHRLVLYFGCLGLGFMLVEIAQLQRFNIYLGHPVLSLTIGLATILLVSGIGSFASGYLPSHSRLVIVLTPIVIAAFAILTPVVISSTESLQLTWKATIAIALLAPMSFFMGMAFPFGFQQVERIGLKNFAPWFWGINGATSVCGSVLAMVLALELGISMTLWIGVAVYVAVAILFEATAKVASTGDRR